MRVFAWSVFPLGFALFSSLILSKFCCEWLARGVIKTIDALLFCKLGQSEGSSLNFFWLIFIICTFVMCSSCYSYVTIDQHIQNRHAEQHEWCAPFPPALSADRRAFFRPVRLPAGLPLAAGCRAAAGVDLTRRCRLTLPLADRC